jgi:hypothetical protein
MNSMGVITLVLVGVGVLLILLGAYLSVAEWKKKLEGKPTAERNALGGSLTGLTKLLEALKGYPVGQQLIVWGIVVLIIAGLFGGVKGL